MRHLHGILIPALCCVLMECRVPAQSSDCGKRKVRVSQSQALEVSGKRLGLPTLSELLAHKPWSVIESGPMLVVNPADTFRTGDVPAPGSAGKLTLNEELLAFHRQTIKAGRLTVIAPTEMSFVEETPHEPPNLYDGLPRELKVNYLLATLNDEQWKQLGQSGLGLENLNQEQSSVFLSLLPNPFRVTRWQLGDKGERNSSKTEVITLQPEQRMRVRLLIYRQARFDVTYVGEPPAFTSVQTQGWPGKPKGVQWTRAWPRYEKNRLFGVAPLVTLPNRLKASQINYASERLNVPVDIKGASNIGELIARIGQATHLELYADSRVAALPLKTYGDKVRSGDVLKGLALAVTGTYRKVNTAYLLTSDIAGLGTRQLRWAEWQSQTKFLQNERQKEWTRLIKLRSGRNSGINALGYSPEDPYALPPALQQEVRDHWRSGHLDFSAAQLTPAIRQLLQDNAEREARQFPNERKLRSDTASIYVTYNFGFQLPDGSLVPSDEPPVGSEDEYLPQEEKRKSLPKAVNGSPALTSFALPSWAKERWLMIAPENPEDASHCVEDAIRLGFTHVVLKTEDKAVLDAGIAAVDAANKQTPTLQPRIFAAIAPFSGKSQAGTDEGNLDRNLMGETASAVATIRQQQPRWKIFVRNIIAGKASDFVPASLLSATSVLAPVTPGTALRLQEVARLAECKGLAGILLYDTQPGGYAGKHSALAIFQSQAGNDVALVERENFGYVPILRLALLRKTGFDPIDMIPSGLHLDIDLLAPFFPDDEACYDYSDVRCEGMRTGAGMKMASQQWDQLRNEANRDTMINLYATLHDVAPHIPLYMAIRAAINGDIDAVHYRSCYAEWDRPELLPTAADASDTKSGKPGGKQIFAFVPFSNSDEFPAHASLIEQLGRLQKPNMGQTSNPSIAFDLSHLPAPRAMELLKRGPAQWK